MISLPSDVKAVLQEQHNQRLKKPIKAVKLPCGCAAIQITKPVDQFVICPKCGKRHFVVMQRRYA